MSLRAGLPTGKSAFLLSFKPSVHKELNQSRLSPQINGEIKMNQIECIECAAAVELPADAIVGELLVCEECDAELEVTNLSPITIELAPEVEEDWGE